MRIETYSPRGSRRTRSGCGGTLKYFAFIGLLAALCAGALIGAVQVRGAVLGRLGAPSPALNPLETITLTLYLALNGSQLDTPAGDDINPQPFVVNAGENAGDVAARLASLGIVTDGQLLRYYMKYKGIDGQIEAGTFFLSNSLTIPAVAQLLTDALPDEVRIIIWEGWRTEQIAEHLAAQPDLNFDLEQFSRFTAPGGARTGAYSFLGDLPPGASLEGFLFPNTYRFLPKAGTAEILDRLLTEFDQQVTPQLRADAAARGYTLYEVITLASIIEREAVHDEERPIIASVFLNRLAIGMRLDADPTTQYAIATPADWWPQLHFDPRTVDHPYNTYAIAGLPPGPISNPGLESIRAVVYPAETNYYFFRARCDGSQFHNFSVTYEEHLAFGCP